MPHRETHDRTAPAQGTAAGLPIAATPGPTQGIAGGPGPTPPGFDDGTPKPLPETHAPEPVAQEDAREAAERGGSESRPPQGARGRRGGGGEGKRRRGSRR